MGAGWRARSDLGRLHYGLRTKPLVGVERAKILKSRLASPASQSKGYNNCQWLSSESFHAYRSFGEGTSDGSWSLSSHAANNDRGVRQP